MAQQKIEGAGHGKPRMFYGSDGSDWYAVQVDPDGHVQMDVVTSGLPAGAATEATLGDVLAEVLKFADIVYQGEHYVRKAGAATTATGVYTDIVSNVVPTGKVWYVYAFACSAASLTELIEFRLQVGAGVRYRLFYQLHSPIWQGVCYLKATAGQIVKIVGKQDSGGDLLIIGHYVVLELDA